MNRLKDAVIEAKKRCRELRKRQTPAEAGFWELVRDRKFHGLKFYRQHPLFFELDGRTRFFIADLFCHECRLAIEIDGPIHDQQKEQDAYRDYIVGEMDISLLRFTNNDILDNPKRVLSLLENHIGQSSDQTPSLHKRRGRG